MESLMVFSSQKCPWFAVQVKSCREKFTSLHLENSGYECYLPMAKCIRRWSDRFKELDVPLFPGYLFCRMNPHNRLPILMTPGVIQIVGTGKTPIPVDEEEIEAIHRVTSSDLSSMPWPYLQVGEMAQIMRGPLQGLSGIIVRIKSGLKLVLSVSLLQRSVAVQVERAWVCPAPAVQAAPINSVAD